MFANIPPLIWLHLAATIVALPLGLQQLLAAKGTPRHRTGGQIYIVAMTIAIVSALATFRPDTPFLPFHILGIIGLVSLIGGTVSLRRWLRDRNPDDLRTHKIRMAYSWIGLAMAGVSQFTSNPRFGLAPMLSPTEFWLVLIIVNAALYALGTWWIFARLAPKP